uniref:Ribonuclease H-like domain, reverse transcriptase, RNA-dependent DNA polymerase n=1 Tax=Tanacetum cinerariifolium TaxID=118510 RepID=A0A6L2P572_TANCI|nr:ribonuclease H-like domain, reverse transcriptase, RNA-dependent DNA polymerase [Tanacetum cinerariifolium]
MKAELDSINRNNTWKLTTLPKGNKAICLKWVFKTKRDANGNIINHKARLVEKGYIQEHGIDFEEVFTPVARMETIRLLLAIAAKNKWEVHHLDIKSAFLHGDLKKKYDIIINGTPKKEINKFKAQMEEKFEMNDLGLLVFPVIHQPPQEMSIQEIKDTKQQYLDEMKRLINSEYRDEIKIDEIKGNFNKDYTFAITPNEPDNSLSTGDEHLDIVSATESDEFIKSSVENLVPNRSESEGENEYFLKEIYSNPLFDEEISSTKIDPHHFNAESDIIESTLNHDSSIISSLKIDYLLDKFASELIILKSIDKTDCDPENEIRLTKRLLYDNSSPRPPEEFISKNSDAAIESLFPSPIPVEDSDSLMEEIDLSFTPDYPMSSGIEEDDYDSERDILILEEFLSNNSILLPENESFHFDIPSSSRPPTKPPDGYTGILKIKMMGDISEQKVPMPILMIICVSNQEKSPDLSPHQGLKIF